jgi:hypothetical protein
MEGGWLPSVEFGSAKLHVEKRHGGRFSTAQGIEAE